MAETRISADPRDVLATFSLGSCVGLALYDPEARLGGLIHFMLPLSSIDPARAQTNPHMFADTGVPALIQGMLDLGARKERLVATVAGAANLIGEQGSFRIGERNYIVVQKLLWKNKIPIAAEDTGGTAARSLSLYVDSGKTMVRCQGQERELGSSHPA